MTTSQLLGSDLWIDRAQAPLASAFLTLLAMSVLAVASMWLKHRICRADRFMKRAKPLIEELYAVATGVVALLVVTLVQYALLGDIVSTLPGVVQVRTAGLPLLAKLSAASLASVFVMVIMASSRTRLARIEIALATDTLRVRVPPDLETAMPRTKKAVILGLAHFALLLEFYMVADLFASNVALLRY